MGVREFINIIFKTDDEDLEVSVKDLLNEYKNSKKISDDDYKLLMKSLENVDKEIEILDKNQIASISLEDGTKVESKKEANDKKAYKEREKIAKQQNDNLQKQKNEKDANIKINKEKSNKGKLSSKDLRTAMQDAERADEINDDNSKDYDEKNY